MRSVSRLARQAKLAMMLQGNTRRFQQSAAHHPCPEQQNQSTPIVVPDTKNSGVASTTTVATVLRSASEAERPLFPCARCVRLLRAICTRAMSGHRRYGPLCWWHQGEQTMRHQKSWLVRCRACSLRVSSRQARVSQHDTRQPQANSATIEPSRYADSSSELICRHGRDAGV